MVKKKKSKKFLKPIVDTKVETVKILTFDIEAKDWTKFLCLGFYDLTLDIYKVFENISEAIDFMFKYCKRNGYSDIFAHFGGKYDFNFILDGMFNHGEIKYTIKSIIPRGSGMLSLAITDKDETYTVTFRDSSALLTSSLKSLGKALNVAVLKDSIDFHYIGEAWDDINYMCELHKAMYLDGAGNSHKRHKIFYDGKEVSKINKTYDVKKVTYYSFETDETFRVYNKEDVKHYLKLDCISLAQCLDKFYKTDFIEKAGHAHTIAGQALKVFQTFMTEPIGKSSKEEDEFIRRAYFGGRTEIFKHIFDSTYDIEKNELKFNKETLKILKSQKGKTLECYDMNSLYPTWMFQGLYPTEFKCFTKSEKDYDPNGFGVWKVKVHVPEDMLIPPLGIQHTNENGSSKYCFPVGTFEGYWTIYEIEYAKTLGVKVLQYIEGAIYYEGKPIFKDFVEDMYYKKRLPAQERGDETTSFIVKLILNSTYGKIGMRSDDKETIQVMDRDNVEGSTFYKDIFIKDYVMRLVKIGTSEDSIFSKVIIPTYVTSYSRVGMHKEMVKIGVEHVYYTDTDSLFVDRPMETGKDLGMMKREYGTTSAVFCLPKTYSIEGLLEQKEKNGKLITGKITAKGMTRKMVSCFTYEDMIQFQIGDVKQLRAYSPEKFDTIKTAMQKGCFLSKSNSVDDAKERYEKLSESIQNEINKAKKEGDLLKAEYNQIQLDKAYERYMSVKPHNYKEIKSRYDKRLPTNNAIETKPIIIYDYKTTDDVMLD